MKRREFIAASAALLVSPRRSLAQGTRRRVGFLAMDVVEPTVQKAWLEGLRNHGWIDGRNLIIEYRYAPSQDRLPALAAELVALSPDLLIAPNTQAALALKSATASIPIVFVGVADPERIGLVQSLSRPGGNITGLSTVVPGFTGKVIEILREMVPTASKIAILVNPGNPIHRLIVAEELPQMARNLGVALPVVEATTAEELDIAFASAAAQHADAISVFGDALTVNNAPRVTALAAKHRLPAIYLFRLFATNGGLISYGPDIADLFIRAGGYVDKILKGTKPSDLPVELPTKVRAGDQHEDRQCARPHRASHAARAGRRGDRIVLLRCMSPLWHFATYVAKVENRTMPKISRKQIFRHLCKLRSSAARQVRGQFCVKQCGPSHRHAKRISGPRKFRSSPKKDFCNNIGTATWGNSGIEPDKGWESALQECIRPALCWSCNDGDRQWNTMLDWTYR